MKKVKLGILILTICSIIITSLGSFAEAKKEKNVPHDKINGAIKITLTKKVSNPAKVFKLVTKDKKKVEYILNKLNDTTYVLAPLSMERDLKLEISNKEVASVVEYEGEVFVQTKENFDKIHKIANGSSVGGAGFRKRWLSTEQEVEMAQAQKTNDASPKSSSETNVQVKGVDEADIVKVSGGHIYYIAQNKVYIAKATDGQLSKAGEIALEDGFYVRDMYVDSNRLVLLGATMKDSPIIGERDFARIVVYDMSNLKEPKVYRTLSQEGIYISSRKIDKQIYLVTQTYGGAMPGMPVYYDSTISAKAEKDDLNALRVFPPYISDSITTVSSFEIDNLNKALHINYVGEANDMYMNEKNLYINYQDNSWVFRPQPRIGGLNPEGGSSTSKDQVISVTDPEEYLAKTIIKKYSLNKGKIAYVGETKIVGTLINQFAMDESNGYFRVAYTKGENYGSEVAVFDKNMKSVGKLGGIAPGERIYSVRFMGDRLYMVTFKQVDPFFVIDMKNPATPTVLGYLKIPGYSTYLHPYDANHILGFGSDTEANTWGGVSASGMKIAMFDVSDVKNPKQKSNVVVGGIGTHSELLHNHKALMYNAEKSYFGFPIEVYDSNNKNHEPAFQGGYVYDVKDYKIVFKGKTSHVDSSKGWNWQYQDQIQRLVYVGDYIYSISPKGISSNRASDMKMIQMMSWS